MNFSETYYVSILQLPCQSKVFVRWCLFGTPFPFSLDGCSSKRPKVVFLVWRTNRRCNWKSSGIKHIPDPIVMIINFFTQRIPLDMMDGIMAWVSHRNDFEWRQNKNKLLNCFFYVRSWCLFVRHTRWETVVFPRI